MMSDTPIEDKQNRAVARVVLEDNAAARVALLLDLSVVSADHLGTFDQTGPTPTAGDKDLMVHIADDETVLALFVRSDAVKQLREAGYDI